MKRKQGATLIEFIAAMTISIILIYMFFDTFTTIFIIHTKEVTREKADMAAGRIMEEILAYDYNDLLLEDSPPGAGTTHDYPGNPVVIDDRDTVLSGDDLTATASWAVVQGNDPDNGSEYKEITLMVTWQEMIAGTEGQSTGFKTEILEYIVRRYSDAQY